MTLAEQRLLDLSAVVERTGISARTWRRIIAAGKIGVLRIQGSCKIPEGELEKYLVSCFTPTRELRKKADPQSIEAIIDRIAPRRRGRPRIAGLAG